MRGHNRQSFTIVEMLVAMALVLFIMAILSEAFVAGLETFRQLKATGDMDERLRTATTRLRTDLRSVYFTTLGGDGNRLSSIGGTPPLKGFFRLWQGLPPTTGTVTGANTMTVASTTDTTATPPAWTIQGASASFPGTILIIDTPPNQETVQVLGVVGPGLTLAAPFAKPHAANFPVVVCEGTDPDGQPSVIANNHTLHFSVYRKYLSVGPSTGSSANSDPNFKSDRKENYVIGQLPGSDVTGLNNFGPPAFRDTSNYYSEWGEVIYFMRPNGKSTPAVFDQAGNPRSPSMPLFALFRRQLVAADDSVIPPSTFTSLDSGSSSPPRAVFPSGGTYYNPGYYEFSQKRDPLSTGFVYFNDPSDLTVPQRRFFMDPGTTAGGVPLTSTSPYPFIGQTVSNGGLGETASLTGADLLITDVLSFEIKPLIPGSTFFPTGTPDFCYLPPCPLSHNTQLCNPSGLVGFRVYDTWSKLVGQPTAPPTSTNPYDYAGPSGTAWDYAGTGGPTDKSIPMKETITALKITLRVWDWKTQRARQITFVQDM